MTTMRRDPNLIFVGHPHFTPDRPESEHLHPDLQEPLEEQLTAPRLPVDMRLRQYRHRDKVLIPEFNRSYGWDRVEESWRYLIDNVAKGTLTTIANTNVATTVTLLNAPNWHLSRWPGAIQLYLCIRTFSMAAQSAIGTVGSIDVQFQDAIGGQTIPLGDFVSNASFNQNVSIQIPTPITDPGLQTIGTLNVLLSGTTPTVSIYNWQMGISAAYVLPCLEGYEAESIHEVLSVAHNR